MEYAHKTLIETLANKVALLTGMNIECQFGILKGKNTCFINYDGKSKMFTAYEDCKTFLSRLNNI